MSRSLRDSGFERGCLGGGLRGVAMRSPSWLLSGRYTSRGAPRPFTRWHDAAPPLRTPAGQLAGVLAAERVPVRGSPRGETGLAGRWRVNPQQARHEAADLVSGNDHVAQQGTEHHTEAVTQHRWDREQRSPTPDDAANGFHQ